MRAESAARIERAVVTSSRSRAGSARALLSACRPRQWSKNALLLAAPLAGGVIAQATVGLDVVAGIVVFCMLSSATYLLNDVRDVEQDRRHHRKRLRPIASGALGVRTALVAAACLAPAGLALAAAVRLELAAVGAGYLILTAADSLWLRVPPSRARAVV